MQKSLLKMHDHLITHDFNDFIKNANAQFVILYDAHSHAVGQPDNQMLDYQNSRKTIEYCTSMYMSRVTRQSKQNRRLWQVRTRRKRLHLSIKTMSITFEYNFCQKKVSTLTQENYFGIVDIADVRVVLHLRQMSKNYALSERELHFRVFGCLLEWRKEHFLAYRTIEFIALGC